MTKVTIKEFSTEAEARQQFESLTTHVGPSDEAMDDFSEVEQAPLTTIRLDGNRIIHEG